MNTPTKSPGRRLDAFEQAHLFEWLKHHAPIDYARVDTVFGTIVHWCLDHGEEAEYAIAEGWSRVFELAVKEGGR